MKSFEMDKEFNDLFKQVMQNPDILNGIVKDFAKGEDGSDDPIDKMVEGTMDEVKIVIEKINNFIETSENYDDFRDEIFRLIENSMAEIMLAVTEVYTNFYENSENLDELRAISSYRQYQAYLDAGFNESQAFSLLTKESKKSDMSTINNFLNQVTKEVSKIKK